MAYTIEEIDAAIRVADREGRREDVMRLAQARQQLMSQQKPQQKNSAMQEIGRQVGLTGRAIAGGLAQVAEPFTDPIAVGMNAILPGNPIPNIEASTDAVMTSAGVPEAETPQEKITQDVGRFAVGFGTGFGTAQKVDDAVLGLLKLGKDAKAGVATVQQLKGIANEAYDVADKAGFAIKQPGFRSFVDSLADSLKDAGIDKTIHPKATAALGRLREAADSGEPIKLRDLEILRRVAGGVGKSVEADERRIGGIIKDALDDYTSKLTSVDVDSGDPRVAVAALKTARDAWARMSKSGVIQEAVERAGVNAETFTGAGFENALRVQFKQIARNKKRMRGFTPEEQDAIRKVAMGGKLDNSFRLLGKLAPTGVVSGGISLGAGYAAGGVPGMALAAGAGLAGRKIATNRTLRNVARADELIRSGGKEIPTEGAPDWLLPWLSGGIFGADTHGEN
jgi:hypothetical protein